MNNNIPEIKTKNCLKCNRKFFRWHQIKLICRLCWIKTEEGKLARKIYNARYYGTPKYFEAVARSHRRSFLKLKKELEAKSG